MRSVEKRGLRIVWAFSSSVRCLSVCLEEAHTIVGDVE